MSQKSVAACVAATLSIAGCATASKDISSTYVSPVQYQQYDCAQIALETQRIQVRVSELGGRLDQGASNDKAIMGVGLVLFWPALFALGGTKQQEAEYGRLRGEYDALQQAAAQHKCGAAPVVVEASAAKVAEAASEPRATQDVK